MRKILTLCLCGIICIALCSCDVTIKSTSEDKTSKESSQTTTTTTTTAPPTTTTAPKTSENTAATTTEPLIYSEKIFSSDRFFSLCYYVSKKDFKVNETITVSARLTNETENTFKVGIFDLSHPVNIVIIKDGEIWGYEGNDTDLCATINQNEVLEETVSYQLTEAGTYQLFIFADFAREIKDFEDPAKVDKNFFHEELGNVSLMMDVIKVNVQ